MQQFAAPPKVINRIERDPSWITPQEAKQVQDWIYELADMTTSMSVSDARQSWWSRLNKHCKVSSYKEIKSESIPAIEEWFQFHRTIFKKGREFTDPEQWRKDETSKLKAAMRAMGKSKEDYYPELARRLKIKPFKSSKTLTKTNLKRVARMAQNDARKWKESHPG